MLLDLSLNLPSLVVRQPKAAILPPTELGAELLAWWDPSDLTTLFQDSAGTTPVAAHGEPVGLMQDKSGNGYHLSQGTAGGRPLWQSDGSLLFDGTDDYLELASQPFPSGATPCEMWAAVRQDALVADTSGLVLLGYGGTASTNSRRLTRTVAVAVNRFRTVTGDGASGINVTDGTVDFSGVRIVRGVFGATETSAYIGSSPATTAAAVPNTATTRVRLGANTAGTAGAFWKGKTGEVAITTGPLTAAHAQIMQAHFNSTPLT